jgi:hypothetical protein
MPQSLASAIGKLKQLRDTLAEPTEFFTQQLDTAVVPAKDFAANITVEAGRWIGVARQIARDIIFHSASPDVDLTEWGLTADYIASLVRILLAPGGGGVVIFLGELQAEFEFAAIFGQPALAASTLTIEQITKYVEAGLRGDPLGKEDISEHDVERTATQTAWNVMIAFRKRNFAGEREQEIVKFLQTRTTEVAVDYFPAILAGWKEMFSVIVPRDFQAWVSATAKRILT